MSGSPTRQNVTPVPTPASTTNPPPGPNTVIPPTPPPAGEPTNATVNPLLPTQDELNLIATNVQANKVASADVVTAILTTLQARHTGASAADLVSLAWACYHNGSSQYVVLTGKSAHQIDLSEIKDIVMDHCTLRQFCMYYAKICYALGRKNKRPPANWASKGYKDATKFAAFDFFSGVLNDAAPSPPGGMPFVPTAEEIAAQNLNGTMSIVESREQASQLSNRGNMMAMQQVRAPPAPPLITFS